MQETHRLKSVPPKSKKRQQDAGAIQAKPYNYPLIIVAEREHSVKAKVGRKGSEFCGCTGGRVQRGMRGVIEKEEIERRLCLAKAFRQSRL